MSDASSLAVSPENNPASDSGPASGTGVGPGPGDAGGMIPYAIAAATSAMPA